MDLFTTRYRVDYLETLRSSSDNFDRFKLRFADIIRISIGKIMGVETDEEFIIQLIYQRVAIHGRVLKHLKNPQRYFDVIVEKVVEDYIFNDEGMDNAEAAGRYNTYHSGHRYEASELEYLQIDTNEYLTHQQKLLLGLRSQGCSVDEISSIMQIGRRIIKKKLEQAFRDYRRSLK